MCATQLEHCEHDDDDDDVNEGDNSVKPLDDGSEWATGTGVDNENNENEEKEKSDGDVVRCLCAWVAVAWTSATRLSRR